jgi:hypothetical protein
MFWFVAKWYGVFIGMWIWVCLIVGWESWQIIKEKICAKVSIDEMLREFN